MPEDQTNRSTEYGHRPATQAQPGRGRPLRHAGSHESNQSPSERCLRFESVACRSSSISALAGQGEVRHERSTSNPQKLAGNLRMKLGFDGLFFLESVGFRVDMSVPSSIVIDRLTARLQSDHISRVNRSTGTRRLGYMEPVGSFTVPDYTRASYLSTVRSVRARRPLAQFRLQSHWMQVDQGRFGRDRLPRDQHMCSRCSSSTVDDEFHMLFKCPVFSELRLNFSNVF